MANNILTEGRDTLRKIYEEVKELGQTEFREKELVAAEDNTEKALEEKQGCPVEVTYVEITA